MLAFMLMIAAFGLFAVTTFAGRIWCGYTCPQTVWTSIFMWLEQKTEGSRNQRIKLDRSPWSLDKALRKVSKHVGWVLVALATGVVSMLFGYPFLTSAHKHLHLPFADYELASAMAFDLGVYLVVVGATLLILVHMGLMHGAAHVSDAVTGAGGDREVVVEHRLVAAGVAPGKRLAEDAQSARERQQVRGREGDRRRRHLAQPPAAENEARRGGVGRRYEVVVETPEHGLHMADMDPVDIERVLAGLPDTATIITVGQGFVPDPEGFVPPAEDGSGVEVVVADDSNRLQILTPFAPPKAEDYQDMPLLIKAQGKCTTDHISMAGPWLKYRGHLDRISDNLLLGGVNAFGTASALAVITLLIAIAFTSRFLYILNLRR